MSTYLPGGEYLTGVLDVISQSLTVPVLIILLIIFIISIVSLGGCISEYSSKKKVSVKKIKNIIYSINDAESIVEVKHIIKNSELSIAEKEILTEIADAERLNKKSREALARKLVENEEEKVENKLRTTDVITRIGPTLGLMGTLIPLGPGLAALGSGDIQTLASSLTVAFNTTIVGIGSGALSYFIGKVRSNWYDNHLSNLDVLTDTLLDYMETHPIQEYEMM